MTRTVFRLVFIGLLLAATGHGVAAPSPTPAPAASASPTPAPTPAGLALTEIAPQAQTKLAALNGIEPDDAPDKITDAARNAFRDLTTRADSLVYQSSKTTAPGLTSSLDALRDQLAAWKKLQETLDEQIKILGDRGAELENEGREIDETRKLWQTTKDATSAKDANVPSETRELVSAVLAAAADARKRVAARRSTVLSLQTTLNDAGTRIAAGLRQGASRQRRGRQDPPRRRQRAAVDAQRPAAPGFLRPLARIRRRTGRTKSVTSARQHWELFALHGAIFAVLLAAMFWLRRRVALWTEEEPHLTRAAPIFRVPVATALALSFVLKGNIYAGTPPIFRALLGAVVLVPIVIILRRVLDKRLGLVLYSLVVFYVADCLRLATAAFPATNRWIFCVELAGAIVVFLLLTRAHSAPSIPTAALHWGGGSFALNALAVLVLAVALGTSVLGYMRLGTLLGGAVLWSSYLAVALFTLLRVVEGLIAIALRVRPATASRVVQQHRAMVQDRAYRVFRAVAVLLWIAVTLDRLQILEPFYYTAAAVLDYRLPLGAVESDPRSHHRIRARHLGVGPDLAGGAVLSSTRKFTSGCNSRRDCRMPSPRSSTTRSSSSASSWHWGFWAFP